MDAVITGPRTPPPGNADAVGASPYQLGCDDPPQLPDSLPVAVVAQRRITKPGTDVCRSPRLSCLPPPQPSMEPQDTLDVDESSDDESERDNNVALYFSRDETPENDALPPDEPSTILANRIIRAYDNPSPPPQDLGHPDIYYVPREDDQFTPLGVSVPLSPFRPINLLERLNQSSDSLFDPPCSLQTPTLGIRSDISEFGIVPSCGFISPGSSSPFITYVPMKSTPNEDLASADTVPSLSTQCAVDDLPSRSSQHVCEPANPVDDAVIDPSSLLVAGLHGQLMTTTSSLDCEVLSSPLGQAIDSSSNAVVSSASDDLPQGPLPRSEQRNSVKKPSPLSPNAETLSSPPSVENSNISPGTETIVPGEQDNNGEEISSVDKGSLVFLKGEQESKRRATSTKELNANSHQRLDSLSPRSTDVLAGPYQSVQPTSSIDQTILPAKSICLKHSLATPPRTPMPVARPDFSWTSVQRPVVSPTPVRANSYRKLNSPAKSSLEADNIYRTPAQRVPIGTALARGTSSFQRTVQLSAGPDQSRPGRFLTIRAPVFTRPALDDLSRSPAKRIPVTDLVVSPTKGDEAQSSPTRLDLRARSISVEPRPLRPILTRSRSAEPCAMILKPDKHGKIKESIFPMVSILPRAGTKLPFPLVSGQKPSSDLPPPIPEEHETGEIGNTEPDALLGRATQSNTMSRSRQPSIDSRIPRIGNKPYARPPPKNGKAAMNTTTANTARAPRVLRLQLACKNSGIGNSNVEVSSIQPTNDQHLVGSLKRKRGAGATTPSISRPVMFRQIVPGILGGKYTPKPVKFPSQVQGPSELSSPKVPQPLKFRRVVDGMLSARYASAKANLVQTEMLDSASLPPSPLSELSSSSNEEPSDEKLAPTAYPPAHPNSETSDTPRTDVDASVVEPSTHEHSSLHQDTDGDGPSSRPRRTSRTRKPAQQQYVLDVFNGNIPTRPPLARRKPQSRTEDDCFMGMSATALKALTTSNTAKNQQTVAVLATEVIRKDGLRPESPTVKARTILQKQRDERDMRRRERAQRRAQMSEDLARDTEGLTERDDRISLDAHADHDENDHSMSQKHRQGPVDEEDYEVPERLECIIEPLRLEGMDRKVKPAKQVKWHRGLSTVVYLDEVDPRPKSLPQNVAVRGCLALTSKNLPLDTLGNLVDIDNRPSPELVTEQIVVKRYLYDNDIEPEPIPAKTTRSKSKKSRS